MKELIDVFRMKEISEITRARIIIKLGNAINNKYQMSITQPLVFELVKLLDVNNDIFKDKNFVHEAIK